MHKTNCHETMNERNTTRIHDCNAEGQQKEMKQSSAKTHAEKERSRRKNDRKIDRSSEGHGQAIETRKGT